MWKGEVIRMVRQLVFWLFVVLCISLSAWISSVSEITIQRFLPGSRLDLRDFVDQGTELYLSWYIHYLLRFLVVVVVFYVFFKKRIANGGLSGLIVRYGLLFVVMFFVLQIPMVEYLYRHGVEVGVPNHLWLVVDSDGRPCRVDLNGFWELLYNVVYFLFVFFLMVGPLRLYGRKISGWVYFGFFLVFIVWLNLGGVFRGRSLDWPCDCYGFPIGLVQFCGFEEENVYVYIGYVVFALVYYIVMSGIWMMLYVLRSRFVVVRVLLLSLLIFLSAIEQSCSSIYFGFGISKLSLHLYLVDDVLVRFGLFEWIGFSLDVVSLLLSIFVTMLIFRRYIGRREQIHVEIDVIWGLGRYGHGIIRTGVWI